MHGAGVKQHNLEGQLLTAVVRVIVFRFVEGLQDGPCILSPANCTANPGQKLCVQFYALQIGR